jgi:hypothetical protein
MTGTESGAEAFPSRIGVFSSGEEETVAVLLPTANQDRLISISSRNFYAGAPH